VLTVVVRFHIVFIQNLFNDRDRFGIIELRIMVKRLVRSLMGMRFISVIVMVVIIMSMGVFVSEFIDMGVGVVVIRNGASAIFTHNKILLLGSKSRVE
jgi:hypothetical protein